MKKRSISLATAALAFAFSTPGSADPSGQPTPASNMKQTPDPNRPICQQVEVIGSRLATKRVCMTQAQWLELKRHDREETEKMQTQRPCSGEFPNVHVC